jgi:hypothetical protein
MPYLDNCLTYSKPQSIQLNVVLIPKPTHSKLKNPILDNYRTLFQNPHSKLQSIQLTAELIPNSTKPLTTYLFYTF